MLSETSAKSLILSEKLRQQWLVREKAIICIRVIAVVSVYVSMIAPHIISRAYYLILLTSLAIFFIISLAMGVISEIMIKYYSGELRIKP